MLALDCSFVLDPQSTGYHNIYKPTRIRKRLLYFVVLMPPTHIPIMKSYEKNVAGVIPTFVSTSQYRERTKGPSLSLSLKFGFPVLFEDEVAGPSTGLIPALPYPSS